MIFVESIEQMKAVQNAQLGNVVIEFSYVLTGTDGKKNTMCIRRIILDAPDANAFIQFENLSEQEIIAWAVNHLGQAEIDAMKNGMKAKLAAAEDNQMIEVAPPWQKLEGTNK
jgi:hypothetical protein